LEGCEEDIKVVFLDTEGLASTSRSETFDVRLFSLALLLSSVFLYNSVGTIDGHAISRLGLVAQLTRHIHSKALPVGRTEDSGTDFAAFFPAFVWVVRDLTVKLEREGKRITSREYLEDSLKPEGGMSEEVEAKNSIRSMLRSFFPERDCITLVRPCNDETALKNLAQAPAEALRPEFKAGVEAFSKKVNSLCSHRKKSLYGNTLTGTTLAHLVVAYSDALNSGSAPVISSAWERVVDAQCAEAVTSGLEAYKAVFPASVDSNSDSPPGQSVILSLEELLDYHFRGQKEGFRVFSASSISDPNRTPPFEDKLRNSINAEFSRVRKANEVASQTSCLKLLESLWGGVKSTVVQGSLIQCQPLPDIAGIGEGAVGAAHAKAAAAGNAALTTTSLAKCYTTALQRFFEDYQSAAKGPSSASVMSDFLSTRASSALLLECAGKVDESRAIHVAALGAWGAELSTALGISKSGEASAVSAAALLRKEGEAALLEVTRSGAEAAERLRFQASSLEKENERLNSRVERLEAAQEASYKRAEESASKSAGELSDLRRRVEELIVARSEAQISLANAAGKASELEAARTTVERTLGDVQKKLAEETRVCAQLSEKYKATSEELELLREALRMSKELAAEEKTSRVAIEDTFGKCYWHPDSLSSSLLELARLKVFVYPFSCSRADTHTHTNTLDHAANANTLQCCFSGIESPGGSDGDGEGGY